MLMGFDYQATPVELEVETTIDEVSEQTPDWKTLSNIMVSDALSFTELTGTTNIFEVKNGIGIPIILAKAYLNAPEKDPASLALAFCLAMTSFGELLALEEDHGITTTNGSIFLQFCWLATNGKNPPAAYSVLIDPFVLGWAQDKHELNIQANVHYLQQSSSSLSKDKKIIFTLAAI